MLILSRCITTEYLIMLEGWKSIETSVPEVETAKQSTHSLDCRLFGGVVAFISTKKTSPDNDLNNPGVVDLWAKVERQPFLHAPICTVDVSAVFVLCRTSRSWRRSLPSTLSSIDNHLQSSCSPLHLNYMKLWGVKRFPPPDNGSHSIWWASASIPSQTPLRLLLRLWHLPPQSDEDKQSLLKGAAL